MCTLFQGIDLEIVKLNGSGKYETKRYAVCKMVKKFTVMFTVLHFFLVSVITVYFHD
jgi:hypothetical protein